MDLLPIIDQITRAIFSNINGTRTDLFNAVDAVKVDLGEDLFNAHIRSAINIVSGYFQEILDLLDMEQRNIVEDNLLQLRRRYIPNGGRRRTRQRRRKQSRR